MKEKIKLWWKRQTLSKRVLIVSIISLIPLFYLANLVFYAASYYPRTCTICHYMKPYYEQWKTSTHKDFICIKCHPYRLINNTVSTIKYLTDTYNPRPIVEVNDASCLQEGCHSERLLKGRVAFQESIIFDHTDHYGKIRRGEKLRCSSCHSQIVQGEHIAVEERVCFLCHFKGAARGSSVTGCPSCHGTPTKIVEHEGFSFSHESYLRLGVQCNQCHLDVAKGEGDVPEQKCHSCHAERLENYKDKLFIHRVHVTDKGIYCFRCHEEIWHGDISMIQPLEVKCDACHPKLHSPQKALYMGVGGKGVKDTPSRMFSAQVSCDGCHIGGRTEKKACLSCHEKNYADMLDDWKKEVGRALSEISPVIKRGESAFKGMKGKLVQEASMFIEDARHNYELLENGHGAHNPEYAVRLLQSAWDQVDIAMKAAYPSYQPSKRGRLLGTGDGYCTILCHSRLGLKQELVFEEMNIEFPHSFHHDDLGVRCTDCHSPEKHKMRIITKDGCMACHHKGDELKCDKCHWAQQGLYLGKVKVYGLKEIQPDIMARADIECEGCHDLKEKDQSVEVLKDKCIDCHEEDYDEILIQWEQDLLKISSELFLKLSHLEEGMKTMEGEKLLETERLYQEAKHNIELISRGKGVHNYELSMKILAAAKESLDKALGKTEEEDGKKSE
ncbi:MAG: cytochrome c3 family protein [Deltaproteobacteria bacterium]|nr:MAG: cytochrome c3 family protein [Deltaproteobacteria bacterium]